MHVEDTVAEYTKKLASAAPGPGGGSASALVAALGAALAGMVGNLTTGKEKYAQFEEIIRSSIAQAEAVRLRLLELVDEDVRVFSSLQEAYRLPKASEEEKAARAEAIQAALKKAAAVPYEIAVGALRVTELGEISANIGNANAVSDAGMAAILGDAAARSAALNVNINLALIDDPAFTEERSDGIEMILKRCDEIMQRVMNITYEKIGP